MPSISQLGGVMVELRRAYPNLFREDQDQWAARVTSYHGTLRRWDLEVVREAARRAPARFPDRFPTAGQLAGLCALVDTEDRRERERIHTETADRQHDADTAATVSQRRREVIPDDRGQQSTWCAAAKNHLERLGRMWECESKNNGWDPDRASPKGVGERRIQELSELMDAVGGFGRVDPHQGPREAGLRRRGRRMREPGDD